MCRLLVVSSVFYIFIFSPLLIEGIFLNFLLFFEMHILKFKAEWCGPCKALTKAIEESGVDIHISTIDIELNMQSATEYGIRSVPTMIALGDHNEEIGRKTGSMTSEQFKAWVESFK